MLTCHLGLVLSWSFVFDISGTSSYRFLVHDERKGMVEGAAAGGVGYTFIKSKGEMGVRASQPSSKGQSDHRSIY